MTPFGRLAGLAAVALVSVAAGCSTMVSGKVLDAASQAPLDATHISLHVPNTRIKYIGVTAKDGTYEVELPDYALDNPGFVKFERAGYQTMIVPPKNLARQGTVLLTAGSDATSTR